MFHVFPTEMSLFLFLQALVHICRFKNITVQNRFLQATSGCKSGCISQFLKGTKHISLILKEIGYCISLNYGLAEILLRGLFLYIFEV